MPRVNSTKWLRLRKVGKVLLALTMGLLGMRIVLLSAATPAPPPMHAALPVTLPVTLHAATESVVSADGVRRLGRSWARPRGGMLQVHLTGSPEAIGDAHSRLLRAEMVSNEGALWDVFQSFVPTSPLRSLIVDMARIRFSGLADSVGYARRAEIAAGAYAFRPDPYRELLPTYNRFLFLNALYDVSLSFEHSPLIGCSSLFVAGKSAPDGPLLGRNFDFEAHEVFDQGKAVIVFAETGKIPVLSVAWPGLSGVVTGLNAEGVAAMVHGARAGQPSASGQPVLLTLREALASGSNAKDVASWLADRDAMVSHVVLVADASGQSWVVERIPGQPVFLRPGGERLALTNHLEGPGASDPANLRVRQKTSTLARRRRLDVILDERKSFSARGVLDVLRDRRDAEGRELAHGDRRAIDADIATHGVVMNLRSRTVWVSQGPHLSGEFVRFDLSRWLADPSAESRRNGSETLVPYR